MNMPLGFPNNTETWYELSPEERAQLLGISNEDYQAYLLDQEIRYKLIDAALLDVNQYTELENV